MTDDAERSQPPFQLRKIGHIVLNCTDIDASVRFYTQVLGLEISDVYGDDLVPGRMVFMRFSSDHHGIALVGGANPGPRNELNHFALEVATLDEVFAARDHLVALGVPINFHGRRRAGSQIAVEFKDPDSNNVEIFWGLDQVGSDGYVRPRSEWRQALTLEDAAANPVPGQQIPRHLSER
jgi:catechol 2,3-dioxygenase-like lactoylglutathione lyase family enzyme